MTGDGAPGTPSVSRGRFPAGEATAGRAGSGTALDLRTAFLVTVPPPALALAAASRLCSPPMTRSSP